MPRSRSRDRRRSRDRKTRSNDRKSRSRDFKRRDRSRSRDKYYKKGDRSEMSRHDRRDREKERNRDRSNERYQSSRHRDKSIERSSRKNPSTDRRRDRSSSRSKKHRKSTSSERSNHQATTLPSTASHINVQLESIKMPNDESSSNSSEPSGKYDPRKTFEIANEFSVEGFEQFTRDHGIDFSNIDTEEDREAVHEKMEEVLKAHFAAQGKIYPPPKIEKPAINAATGFANDGSFLEQFKKMEDDYKNQLEADKKKRAAEERLKSLPIRRRGGGKILKTGIVAKTKLNEDGSEVPTNPWSIYLKEVQKYKNSSCDSDSKTRPLVK